MKIGVKVSYGVAQLYTGVMAVGETDLQLFGTMAEAVKYIVENQWPMPGVEPFYMVIPNKENLNKYITDKGLTIEDGTLEEMKQRIADYETTQATE